VLIYANNIPRIGTAAGRLPDDSHSLESLEVVGERLGRGKGPFARQDVNVLSDVSFPGHEGQRPELPHGVSFSLLQVAQTHRLDPEEIAGQEHVHLWIAAVVSAKVDDQRVGIRTERHRGARGLGTVFHGKEKVQPNVSDVGGQPLDLLKTKVDRLAIVSQA